MKARRNAAVVFGILAAAWAGVLFFFSGQSGVDSSSLSLRVASIIVRWFPVLGGPADFEPVLRKLAHFGIFAVEGFFAGTSLVCALGYLRGSLPAVALCGLMSVANEYHQTFSPDRSCEVRDMLIDTGGALLGVIVSAAAVALLTGTSKRKRPGYSKNRPDARPSR